MLTTQSKTQQTARYQLKSESMYFHMELLFEFKPFNAWENNWQNLTFKYIYWVLFQKMNHCSMSNWTCSMLVVFPVNLISWLIAFSLFVFFCTNCTHRLRICKQLHWHDKLIPVSWAVGHYQADDPGVAEGGGGALRVFLSWVSLLVISNVLI